MPSMPMFTTPDRSHRMPLRAPSAIGVHRETVATSMLISENCSPAVAHTISAMVNTPNEMPRISVDLRWKPRTNCEAPRKPSTIASTHSDAVTGTTSASS